MVVHWVNLAGAIVEKEVENRKAEKACKPKETLPVVEMDELFTYIKKNLAETEKLGSGMANLPNF